MASARFLTPAEHLKVLLKKGLVVKIQGDLPFQSDHPHHFVVLNYNPDTESIIIVAHATHQVETECVKAEEQGENVTKTVVYIKPGTYKFFPKPTVFNCNEVDELTFGQMVTAMDNGFLQIPPDDVMSEEDVARLVEGALTSSQVTPYIASLLQDDTEA